MSLADAIATGATVLVDTNPLVYWFEGHPLAAAFAPVFEAIEQGRIQALVTPITVAEVVAGPLRHGHEALAERYRLAMVGAPGWRSCSLDADVAMLAARLRIRHRLKLPDALQLAAAIHHRCQALVTHDRDFRDVEDLPVLGLELPRLNSRV